MLTSGQGWLIVYILEQDQALPEVRRIDRPPRGKAYCGIGGLPHKLDYPLYSRPQAPYPGLLATGFDPRVPSEWMGESAVSRNSERNVPSGSVIRMRRRPRADYNSGHQAVGANILVNGPRRHARRGSLNNTVKQMASFEAWMAEVDKHLVEKCGLGHMDLPDYWYYDMFEDGTDPEDAAEEAWDHAFES